MRNANVFLKYIFAIIMTFLVVNVSFAADSSQIFEPVRQDVSMNVLSQLFGDLVDKAVPGNEFSNGALWLGTGLDPFQNVLYFFNWACAAFGGMLATYAVSIGLVNTAHEGVSLGKELNTPFFWFRTSFGVITILPVLSGYCLLQLFVMWGIAQFVGLADTLWKGWFQVQSDAISTSWNDASGKTRGNVYDLYSLKMPSLQAEEVVYKAFEGYTCIYGLASERIQDEIDMIDAKHNTSNIVNPVSANITEEQGAIVYKKPTFDADGQHVGYERETKGNDNITAQQFEEKRREEVNKLEAQNRRDYQQKYNNERNRVLKTLDNKVATMFKMKSHSESDFNKEKAQKGPYFFGIDTSVSKTNVNGGTANTIKTACGFIDFTRATGSMGQSRVLNVVKAIKKVKNGQTSSEAKNNGFVTDFIQSADKQSRLTNRNITKTDEQKVLEAYANLYPKLDAAVKSLAHDYVTEINEKVRFRPKDENNKDREDETLAKLASIKEELLIKYNDKLVDIQNQFEQSLLSEIHKIYAKQSRVSTDRLKSSIAGMSPMGNNENGNYVDLIKRAQANAEIDGWFDAGMWYMSITQSISKMHELVGIRPEIGWANPDEQQFRSMIGKTNSLTANVNVAQRLYDNYGFFDKHALYSPYPNIQQKINENTDTVNSMAALAVGFDLNNMFDTARHPVVIMTESGHNLIAAAEKFMTRSSYWYAKTKRHTLDKTKGKEAQSIPDPNNPASQSQVMLSYLVSAVMVMGIMLAYYLPILPFLIWIGALLGWLVSVIEAIFIAPLWGAMHIHPEGNKYTGKGSAGYGILLSVLLKPPLMILGLIASLVVVQVFGMFVNYIFAIGLNISLNPEQASTNITLSKIMYIMSLYAIYIMFMQSLLTKMFNIITIVPDNILKWVGGVQGNLSEYGAIGGHETYGKINALASTAGNVYGQKLKERAEMAGTNDANVIRAQNPKLDETQMQSLLRSAPLGSGYSELTAHEYGDNKNGITLAKAETHTVPQGFMEQQNYNEGLKTAKSATQQSGMSQEQSEKVSVGLAEQSVRTPQLTNAINHVQNNGGFNSEQGRNALTQASQAGSPQEALQIIENYGKSVNAEPAATATSVTHNVTASGSSSAQGNVSAPSTLAQTKADSAASSIVAASSTTESASGNGNGTTTTTQTATVTSSQPQAAQATTQAQTTATRVAQAVSSNNNSSSIT